MECFRCSFPLDIMVNYDIREDLWTCPACGCQFSGGVSDPTGRDDDDDDTVVLSDDDKPNG